VEVFFDGDCPLCRWEMDLLARWDRRGRIRFTNIAQPGFSGESCGRTQAELMAEIHGRLPDGTWIQGVEVFRQLYGAVGFQWLVPVTRWPLVRQALDLGYRLFARNRLRLTGRCHEGLCRVDR
jgi:predicted DCC family thiol-disulfide oxidoreductase YuxK